MIAFLVPSGTARTALMLPICMSIISLFAAEGRSKFATNLLLVMSFTNSTIAAGILTTTVPNPVVVEFLAKTGKIVTYTDWLIYGFPPALVITFFTWWFIQKVFKPEAELTPGGADRMIRARLQALGKTTAAEWRMLAVFLLITVLWTTQKWTNLDATVVCLLGDCLLFLPKFGVLTWSDANKEVSWQVILIAGGGVSLGEMLMKTGAAKWLASSIFKMLGLQGASILLIIIVVMFIVQYLHLLLLDRARHGDSTAADHHGDGRSRSRQPCRAGAAGWHDHWRRSTLDVLQHPAKRRCIRQWQVARGRLPQGRCPPVRLCLHCVRSDCSHLLEVAGTVLAISA